MKCITKVRHIPFVGDYHTYTLSLEEPTPEFSLKNGGTTGEADLRTSYSHMPLEEISGQR